MSTIRTWTLALCPSGEDGVEYHLAAVDGPEDLGTGFADYECDVIEAGPVLDLLERAWRGRPAVAVSAMDRRLDLDIEELLRAHDRLGGNQ